MKQRGHESDCERIPWERLLAVAWGVGAVGTALVATTTGDALVTTASLLFIGDVREKRGLTWLVGWLVGGSLLGAGLGYGAALLITGFPLATQGAVGLGIALGGGVGVVSNYLPTTTGEVDDEAVTVEMDDREAPDPTPADLFDGHPDPVLYVVDEGHGPVVRAANDAYAEAFDVPADRVLGAPLSEAVLIEGDPDAVLAPLSAGEGVDAEVTCQTAGGPAPFRLRVAGDPDHGYLLFTPLDA